MDSKRKLLRQRLTTVFNKATTKVKLEPNDIDKISEVLDAYAEWQDELLAKIEKGEDIELGEDEEVYREKAQFLRGIMLDNTVKERQPVSDEIRQAMKLDKFSGKFSDFPFWYGQFKVKIDQKCDIACGEKAAVLKSYLDSKTRKMVEHMPDTKEGYSKAKETLESFFDNKQAIVDECLGEVDRLTFKTSDTLEFHQNVLILAGIAHKFEGAQQHTGQAFEFQKKVLNKLPLQMKALYIQTSEEDKIASLVKFLQEQVDKVQRMDRFNDRGTKPTSKPHHKRAPTCHYCHKVGHLFAQCKERLDLVCNNCNVKGHIAKFCKVNKVKKPYNRAVCRVDQPGGDRNVSQVDDHNIDPRVYTSVEIGGESATTLVDPGSVATFVPEDLIPEADGTTTRTFTTADGTTMETEGPFIKDVSVDSRPAVKWPVYAQDSKVAILGADFLKKHKAVIDMAKGQLVMPDPVPTANDDPPESSNLVPSSSIGPVEVFSQSVETDLPPPNPTDPEMCRSKEVSMVEAATSQAQHATMSELVSKHDQLFEGIGLCERIQHEIDTGDSRPVSLGSRRIPVAYHAALDKHVDELLEKDIIEVANGQWCSPINPVKKKDGSIRLTIDFRELNQRTRWDAWPMPKVDEILNKLGPAKWFTRIDLTSGYYQIPLEETSKEKTGFRYRNKLYQFKRMPMGLVTAPQTFQRLMTTIFSDLDYVECYLDDVIVYSSTEADHLKHVAVVLQRIRKNGLRLNRNKCKFGVNEIEILGSKISNGRRYADDEKRRTMASFPVPKNAKQVKAFLGFANYLRSLLPNFALVTRPLVEAGSTKRFEWSPECQESFDRVKTMVAANPMTFLPDLNEPFIVTTDASDTGMGAVLSQTIDGERRVIEFASKHFTPTQQRYSTIEKEATAILFALTKWRHFLLGQEITIETDHRPLHWLLTKKECPDKLGRMAAQLQEFRIKGIDYIPGESNVLADTLSRLQVAVINRPPRHTDTRIRRLAERFPDKYRQEGDRIVMVDREYRRVCVETQDEREHIFRSLHDQAGHLRYDKTAECLRKRFYWPNWQKHLKQYLRECKSCAKMKDDIETAREKLQPLESKEAMERVHVDICGQLTPSRGHRYFAVMVDAFTKWTEAKAFRSVTAINIIRWLREVFNRLGVPKQITTDHGSQFDSREFRGFCAEVGTELHLTTVGHHESNGLAERTIQTLERMVRTSITDQSRWSDALQQCVSSYNSRVHATTGLSPHVLMHGEEPVLAIDQEYGLMLPTPDMNVVRDRSYVKRQRQIKRMKWYYDREFKPSKVKVGDKVLWHTEEIGLNKSRKLNRRWRGPFVVVELCTPKATVEDARGQHRQIHLNQLKKSYGEDNLDTFRGRGRPRNEGEV